MISGLPPLPEPVPSSASSTPDAWNYDQNLVIDVQLKWILRDQLPFRFFDNDRWTNFIQEALQPEYQRVSKTTIKRLAFKYYIQAKKDLVKYFEIFKGKVSLTIHVWDTLSYGLKYVCITCHWIDPDTWKISRRIISIRGYKDIHDIITECVWDFKLKDKILSVCFDYVDNGIDFEKGFEMLKKDLNPMLNGVLFQTKCVLHILMSMVRICLDYVHPFIEKLRNMRLYAFFYKYDEFDEYLNSKGVKFRNIVTDFRDFWNTTYRMLRGLANQRLLITEFYANSGENNVTDNDWEIVDSLLGILKVFRASTVCLANTDKHPTSSLVLGEALLISSMFKQYKQDPFWEPVISQMQSKFLEYFESIPVIYSIAAALNPTIGVEGVENIIEDIAGNLGLDMNSMADSNYATISIARFRSAFKDVFDYYDNQHGSKALVTGNPGNAILHSVLRKKSETATISSDLELYKRTDFLNIMSCDEYENLKILDWWRMKGRHQYPVLGAMASDILTVQAGSEALEYAFCLKGRVLGVEESSLSPWWVQRRVFLKQHFDTIGWEPNADMVESGLEEIESDNYDKCSDYDDEE